MPENTSATQSPEGRLVWADIAKGMCIVLVVLHHLTGKHYAMVVPQQMGPVAETWLWLVAALKPLRMPLFFVVSGLFAAAAIQRPWRGVLARRVLSPYYLYAVWLGIHAVIFSVAQTLPMNRTQDLGELVADLLFASTGLWYLYALALYFLLAKALRPAGVWFVLAFATTLAALTPMLSIDEVNRASLLRHFVYFAVGVYVPTVVTRMADLRNRHTIAVLLVSYVLVGGAMLWLSVPTGWAVLAVSVVAVPLGIRWAVALSGSHLASLTVHIGRRTLPIYVLHVPVLSLLHHLLELLPSVALGPIASAAFAVAYPPVATAVVTVVCLVIHSALVRIGLDRLFRSPFVATRSTGAASGAR